MGEATIQAIVNTTRRGRWTQFVDLGTSQSVGVVGGVDLDRMLKMNTSYSFILLRKVNRVLFKRS